MESVMREEMNNEAVMPKKEGGLTGSTLKWIAIVTMFIDHFAAAYLTRILIQRGLLDLGTGTDQEAVMAFMQENGALYFGMLFMRIIGRIAFPIFCFLLVEGFLHTSNVKKYVTRLAIFALITEVPFNLALSGSPFFIQYQSVMVTLLLAMLMLCGVKWVEGKEWKKFVRAIACLAIVAAAAGAATLLQTDYKWSGVLCVAGIYYFSKQGKKVRGAFLGCAFLIMAGLMEVFALIGVAFIAFYNGKRGMKMKYFFYAFYPAHLFLLWLLSAIMGLGGINTMGM